MKGLCFCNTKKKWRIYVYKNKKTKTIGYFNDKDLAIQILMKHNETN